MKMDWKYIATTMGYKSLKKAYIDDVQKKWRSKSESLCKFQWVISRAKHFAHHTGKSIESILNTWEEKRSYWWLNYYREPNQPKFHSRALKPMGINGVRKHYKKTCWSDQNVNSMVNAFIQRKHKLDSKKLKKRWSMARKQRYK